jgi:hypothetical protein
MALLRRSCGTMETHTQMLQTDPVYRANRLAIESFTAARVSAKTAAGKKIVKIPVVVHVVYASEVENISDAQVKSCAELPLNGT